MGIKIEKLADLEYNEIVTLGVIEQDSVLSSIFLEDVKMSFNMVKLLSKENNLNEFSKLKIYEFFDKIILTNKNYIDKYKRLISHEITTNNVIEEPTNNIDMVVDELKNKEIKEKKENKLPRRYGKNSVLKDIEKQGGKPTNAQLTALSVNELKNTYVNLNSRLIKDMLMDKPILTDEDYRDIRATITIVKNKLKDILKKK